MLRELAKTRQRENEPKRRWFFCHELDLVVWQQTDQAIYAFQLAYNKHRHEAVFCWHQRRGFEHYRVDDGERLPGENRTPIFSAVARLDAAALQTRFLALAEEVPPEIVQFVQARLQEYDH